MSLNPNCDKRPPRGGWAPGNYMALCGTCRAGFIGDKRATQCADCAHAPVPFPDELRDRLLTDSPSAFLTTTKDKHP